MGRRKGRGKRRGKSRPVRVERMAREWK